MQMKDISFYSEGCKLDGTLYLPDDYKPGEKRPAIIPNSGYQGFDEFYPRLFSNYLTKAGYVCLGFDYRGMAKSEGEKGRVILDEQVQDVRNAITFLQLQDEVDPERIGLVGWGMGASNVIRAAAQDRRVKAVAGLNGFYNGERWLRSIHSFVDWTGILETVAEDRARRVTTGKSKPEATFIHYPLDPATSDYVKNELESVYGFGHDTQLQFSESIIELNCDKVIADIAPRPVFIGHGKDNLLHPIDESVEVFAAAAEPKAFYQIDGKHNDFMFQDHPIFDDMIDQLEDFFAEPLKAGVYLTEPVAKAV
jgi:fermentation-respiration switch protein FrsA (DUF1100 family)